MNNLRHRNYSDIVSFLEACEDIEFVCEGKAEAYALIEDTLYSVKYWSLKKQEKKTLRAYLYLLTGYSKAQLSRLIAKAKKGTLKPGTYRRNRFARTYTDRDIALLAKTDGFHLTLNGKATKEILKRECEVFGNMEFARLASISVSHIYNLRKTALYGRNKGVNYTKTAYCKVAIGKRTKPDPNGMPGFLRVDTVHQGDRNSKKGLYSINSIDEVTQFEIVGAVEKISERFLVPLLEGLIDAYPFKIVNFHADNGSEYINQYVAKMLNRLLIKLTKSRSRKTNDNALVEGKNGAIIRKHMGHIHIPAVLAPLVHEFYTNYLNPYLNYHRPCGFAEEKLDIDSGKIKKVYNSYMTPYEKLKSLDEAAGYLRFGLAFDELDKDAYAISDNEAAKQMQQAKQKLLSTIFRKENFQ